MDEAILSPRAHIAWLGGPEDGRDSLVKETVTSQEVLYQEVSRSFSYP